MNLRSAALVTNRLWVCLCVFVSVLMYGRLYCVYINDWISNFLVYVKCFFPLLDLMLEWSFKSFVHMLFYVSREYFNILGNQQRPLPCGIAKYEASV